MQQIELGQKIITSEKPALIMGIVNATPDSFYEKSRGGVDLALRLIDEGADILDIGGESTRPGFSSVNDDEQISRIIPVIKEIRKHSDIPISVDTRSSVVFKRAFEEGADIFNDVSAMENDKNSCSVIKNTGASVILMHGYGLDENHCFNTDICQNVKNYLMQRTEVLISNDISKNQILWDPGIGFGKTMEENVFLIKNTDKLSNENFPLVMALSRKRVISFMTDCEEEGRLTGTIAANLISVQKGAKILRVHDVKETLNMLNIMKNLQ